MISVIIPTFQDTIRLNQCLHALNHQNLEKSEFEVIVVNNCPSENLEIDFEGLQDLNVKIFLEVKSGSYAARNKGIKESRGGILAFTDSDCLPDPNWLKTANSFFESNKQQEIGILTGPVKLIYKDNEKLSAAEIYEKFTAFHTLAYAKEGFAVTANWISFKSVIKEFGGFNSKLKSNGDSELSGKISQKFKLVFSNDLFVYHPARFTDLELVNKYKRRLGGTYNRLYEGKNFNFGLYTLNFIYKRYRFVLKKLFTVSPKESIPLLRVCHRISIGAVMEYLSLIKGRESKRL